MNIRSMAWLSEQELTKPDMTARKDTIMFTVFHDRHIRRVISGLLTTNILCHGGAMHRNKLSAISNVTSPFNARLLVLR